MPKRNIVKCPECGEVVDIDSYNEVGDEIACHHCDSILEITSLSPPKVKVVRKHDYLSDEDETEDDNGDEDSEDEDIEELDDYDDRGDRWNE
jgi:DNA-directed RNA polymerase subunit RPC12/RpoP